MTLSLLLFAMAANNVDVRAAHHLILRHRS